MVAPMALSSAVYPKRRSCTVSWTTDRPRAWVRRTTNGCCQSVAKPGWTSVSRVVERSSPPRKNRTPPRRHLELAADTAERVEKRHERGLLGILDQHVAVARHRRRRKGRDL